MIIKIDVENACETLNWIVVLASLYKMGFPQVWISWIKFWMSSSRFSFLINRQPTGWISPSRCVHQEDLLSPYLFILTYYDLTATLNKSLEMHMVPGFNSRMNLNFNHFMYPNDLILVTRARRKATTNCWWGDQVSLNVTQVHMLYLVVKVCKYEKVDPMRKLSINTSSNPIF